MTLYPQKEDRIPVAKQATQVVMSLTGQAADWFCVQNWDPTNMAWE